MVEGLDKAARKLESSLSTQPARQAKLQAAIGTAYRSLGFYPEAIKVLITGGYESDDVLTSAELRDPIAGSWAPTGSPSSVRGSHSATLLPNGKVLVAGGGVSGVAFASAELFSESDILPFYERLYRRFHDALRNGEASGDH